MRSDHYSYIDPNTGNVVWDGPLSLEEGDHSNMPGRTAAYLPGDERGHVNGSAEGGGNTRSNVVPQAHDLNHGAYYSMEQGERAALRDGAGIESEKTAFVSGQVGDRPSAFIVNDDVTYADGHTESIHLSFANVSDAKQEAWNDLSASLPGAFDAPNPGDGLRDSMTAEEYAELMEATDAELPGIADEYAPTAAAGPDDTDAAVSASDDTAADAGTADTGADADASADDGGGADCDPDE